MMLMPLLAWIPYTIAGVFEVWKPFGFDVVESYGKEGTRGVGPSNIELVDI